MQVLLYSSGCRCPTLRQTLVFQVYEEYWQGISKAGNGISLSLPNHGTLCSHPRNLSPFLQSALQAIDDALSSAADAKTKSSKNVDQKFERAIEILSRYEMKCHPKNQVPADGRFMTVLDRMAKAKKNDRSSSAILNVLKEKLSARVRLTHIPYIQY